MSSPLSAVAWEETCLLQPVDDPALEAFARRLTGVPHPSIRYFVRSPWVARMMVRWLTDQGRLIELDMHHADLVGLVVSQENSCRYCYAAVRCLLRIQGMSEARVQMLEQSLARADVEPALAAALRFARSLSRCNPPPAAADVAALRAAGYGSGAIRDLAFAVASTVLLNRIATIAALQPRQFEEQPDRFFVKLLRPLIASWLERHRRPGEPVIATPSSPFAIVADCGASPVGVLIAETLAEMDEAPALSQRCRALMFAVIARALGARRTERESTERLRRDGIGESMVERALAHLDAPALDDTERLLLPFARETVWYQPAQLQRRARPLSLSLSAEQFTDAIGVMALANALCRLELALAAAED